MTEPRMPKDTPEWTGDDPLERQWPARAEVGGSREPEDEVAEEPFAVQTPPEEDTGEPLAEAEPEPEDEEPEPEPEPELPPAPPEQLEAEQAGPEDEADVEERAHAEHAAGEIDVPDGYAVIEGYPVGHRRAVAVVVARFNGEITNRMLASALEELATAGVAPDAVTVMPVPGAFELPLGAMALAKTRRFSCVVALGCVIRGETPHFDYVAGESASGLQLAGIETGVPVSFGVLTCDTLEQAEARVDKGAEAVRTALEMADVFAQVRASARG
ncbi:MAG TPA: 6,7-dimethyl-8-ribityllumazine synthase [Gaiellaceae bacterium]|nr:6,7-dimethyl-8-ribityllumazine synthase [Gaiellaceae bacterium]